MSVVVKKFGGSSVANIDRIEYIADQILKFSTNQQRLVIVVSAMQGETDRLENLAYQISESPDPREMAGLLATGEQVVISLLAMALLKRGLKARSYTGLQLGIETTGIPTRSKITQINLDQIQRDLQEGYIVIVAGFQGVDPVTGDLTTLGRGGSDTTAVALAIALKAIGCDIYTDVDGIYTADPNIVTGAKKLTTICFNEMLELSYLGAKVMQIKAVELGSYYQLPIKVLSSFNMADSTGTMIQEQEPSNHYCELVEANLIKFAALKDQIRVNISQLNFELLSSLLHEMEVALIELDLFDSSILQDDQLSVSFVIANKDLCRFKSMLLHNLLNKLSIEYKHVAKLSMVGVGLSEPRMIHGIYSSLRLVNLWPHKIVLGETKVSMLLDEKDLTIAMQTLHQRFIESRIYAENSCY